MLGADFALLNAHAAPSEKEKELQLLEALHRASYVSDTEVTVSTEEVTDTDIPLDFLPANTEHEPCDPTTTAATKIAAAARGRFAREKLRAEKLRAEDEQPAKPIVFGEARRRQTDEHVADAALDGGVDASLAALCEAWLPEGVRMVVWDFDHTILSINTVRTGVVPDDVKARWQADVCDLALFRTFVHVARRRGVLVGVASFGRSDVILAYMTRIFESTADENAFHAANVATPEALGLVEGRTVRAGKPRLLKVLRNRAQMGIKDAPAISRAQVLFFDDKLANVQTCRAYGFSRCHHVPDGFSRQALPEACAQAAVVVSTATSKLHRMVAALRVPVAKLRADRSASRRQAAAHSFD